MQRESILQTRPFCIKLELKSEKKINPCFTLQAEFISTFVKNGINKICGYMFVYSLIYIVCWFIFFIYLFIFFFIHFIVRLSRRHKLTRMYPPSNQKFICTPLCLLSNRTGNHHFLRGSLINLVPQQSPLLKPFACLSVCMSTNSWTYWWNMVPNWFFGIRDFSYLKLETWDFKAGRDSGLKVCVGGGIPE